MNRGIEVLSPASYIQYSNWLFQESKGTRWTPEENKQFEKALALFDKDTPDKWFRVAEMVPGKTVGDVIKHYKELEEDVSDIEAGLFPIPGYGNSSFTLEWVGSSYDRLDGLKNLYSTCRKRGAFNGPSEQERKKGIPWTEEEHRQFLMGLKKYGKGDWRSISRHFVTTRTPTQVASHAQKYFIRQVTGAKDKRRSSIHDITTGHLPDIDPPSPATSSLDNSPATASKSQPYNQHQKSACGGGVERGLLGWKQSKEISNSVAEPVPGVSSHGYKYHEQNLFGGVHLGSQFAGCNPVFQVQPY